MVLQVLWASADSGTQARAQWELSEGLSLVDDSISLCQPELTRIYVREHTKIVIESSMAIFFSHLTKIVFLEYGFARHM